MSEMTASKRETLSKLLAKVSNAQAICMLAPGAFYQDCGHNVDILQDEQVRKILRNIDIAEKSLYQALNLPIVSKLVGLAAS